MAHAQLTMFHVCDFCGAAFYEPQHALNHEREDCPRRPKADDQHQREGFPTCCACHGWQFVKAKDLLEHEQESAREFQPQPERPKAWAEGDFCRFWDSTSRTYEHFRLMLDAINGKDGDALRAKFGGSA